MAKKKITHADYLLRAKQRQARVLELHAKGLSQPAIARKVGVTQPRVCQIVAAWRKRATRARPRMQFPIREVHAE